MTDDEGDRWKKDERRDRATEGGLRKRKKKANGTRKEEERKVLAGVDI